MSLADEIFIRNCKDILTNGVWDTDSEVRPRWEDGIPAHTIKRFALVNRYDLSKEFPLMTLRKINYKAAIDEILWIYQKKSNKVADLNSHIWDSWADKDGTIGKAYGYQIGVKHEFPEGTFDQMEYVLWQLRHTPQSRRIITNTYNHADLKAMRLAPCAYSVTYNVSGNKLNMLLNQRSQDMLVANNWNVCQYAALLMMVAQISGLKAGELVHVIADAHIYDRHVAFIRKLIESEGYPVPRVELTERKSFGDFIGDDFKVYDYKYNEFSVKIPVAI